MRLQLDTAIGSGGVDSTDKAGGTGAAGQAGSSARTAAAGVSDSRDSSSVSGTSSILNSLAADRTARIQQLTSLVQGGSYQVPGAAVSHALVGQAIR